MTLTIDTTPGPTESDSTGYAARGFTILARIVGHDGAAITQSATSSITYAVYDRTSNAPQTALTTGSMTVASVVFDTLQTDVRWVADTTGYNFRYDAVGSIVPSPGRVYRVIVTFTPSSGQAFQAIWDHTTVSSY